MRTWTLSFLLGILFLQNFTFLPHKSCVIFLIFIFFIIEIFLVKKFKYLRLLAAAVLGFSWALLYAHHVLFWQLPAEFESKSIPIEGYIASIPNTDAKHTSFIFQLKKIANQPVNTYIKLSIPNLHINVHAGEKWLFTARLKKIYGFMNPGGFDYEGWAFHEKLRATGYVVAKGINRKINDRYFNYPLTRVREKLKSKIEKLIAEDNASAWLLALALGERNNIPEEQWEVLRQTGTNHLMAIAGLHIGLIASLSFIFASLLWRQFPRLTLLLPAQQIGALAALVMAFIYSALAGFALPTQRACIMITTALFYFVSKRQISAWHAWTFALLLILIINPLDVLSESFWLSFTSVALIIYGTSARLNSKGLWWKLGRIQWITAIGLIPISIGLFQQFSVISFLANSIAIPWVTFLIVPLILLGVFCILFSMQVANVFFIFANKLLVYLWVFLTYLSKLSFASFYVVVPNHWLIFAASIGVLLSLLPKGFPGRYFGFIWLLLLYQITPKPIIGNVKFTLLDVGQGLSAVVQTKNHVLVFDAGPKLNDHFDMGESVVTPYLRYLGIKQIDKLVISHGDNDHIGGAFALLKNFIVNKIETSVPEKFQKNNASLCLQNTAWVWDNVNFSYLYPTKDTLNLDNNSSCVLKVTTKNHKSVLLTGDIEKVAEENLIANEKENLKADILVAPHHGSKTSDLDSFIYAVQPGEVLFPLGYKNRYHFPHREVVSKYQNEKAKLFFSDKTGAMQFDLSDNMSAPSFYRPLSKHYWNN